MIETRSAVSSAEELITALETRMTDFERGFVRAKKVSNDNWRSIEDRGRQGARNLETTMAGASARIASSLKGLAASFAGGFVGGLAAGGITGIVSRLGSIARGVASIGDEAKRAGVSVRAFQELRFVAEQNRIGVDALVDGLKELNLRADEWIVTGGGSAAEAFERLGFTASELRERLKDPSALLAEIIGRMQRLNEAARIRVADEIFGGTAGERFVELVGQGAEGIRATIDEANRLGIVLDEEVIQRAAEIDRQFNAIATTVGTRLKGAVVDAVAGLREFANSFAEIDEQTTDNITRRLQDVYRERQALQDQLVDMEAQLSLGPNALLGGEIERQRRRIEDLAREALHLRDILDRRSGYPAAKAAGDESATAKPKVGELADTLAKAGASAANGAKGFDSFASALRAIQAEIPGLSASLAELDARTRIDAAYQAAAAKARTMGEVQFATAMREQALEALNIKGATSDPSRYLGGFLRTGQSLAHVEGLANDFASALAEMMASAPESVRAATSITSGFRSFQRQAELFDEAVKKYGSEEAARKWVAPPGKSQHNAGNAADLKFGTDEARQWFHANASRFGLGFPMGHEPWHIQSQAATGQQNDDDFRQRYEAAQQQAQAYAQIVAGAREFTQAQQQERTALGLTTQEAARLRYEQQLLGEAQRAGIALTPAQTDQLRQLAAEMARVEEATRQAGASQRQMSALQGLLGQQFQGFFSGIISGSMTAEQALKRLVDALLDAALQALLLGQGPLAGLFGAGGGGLFGWIAGLFGAADGGAIPAQQLATGGAVQPTVAGLIRGPGGPRADAITTALPAGSFIVNAASTARHRPLLDQIRKGATPVRVSAGEFAIGPREAAANAGLLTAINSGRLPAFADGGSIGTPSVPLPRMPGSGAAAAPRINVSSPTSINFAPNVSTSVNVTGGAGSPEQNSDLASKISVEASRAIENSVRGLVVDELVKQMRVGNLLSKR